MKPSFFEQNRNETAGNSFFVRNSEAAFSPTTFFSVFCHSYVFPFSVPAFFPPHKPDVAEVLFIFTVIKYLLGNSESKLCSEQQKECNVSSCKILPTVPVSISTQEPKQHSDHVSDLHLQFGLTAYWTGTITVKFMLWPPPQHIPSLNIFTWSLVFMQLVRIRYVWDFHCRS